MPADPPTHREPALVRRAVLLAVAGPRPRAARLAIFVLSALGLWIGGNTTLEVSSGSAPFARYYFDGSRLHPAGRANTPPADTIILQIEHQSRTTRCMGVVLAGEASLLFRLSNPDNATVQQYRGRWDVQQEASRVFAEALRSIRSQYLILPRELAQQLPGTPTVVDPATLSRTTFAAASADVHDAGPWYAIGKALQIAAAVIIAASVLWLLVRTMIDGYLSRTSERLGRGLCPRCGYDLRSSGLGLCPECGNNLSEVTAEAREIDAAINGEAAREPDRRERSTLLF